MLDSELNARFELLERLIRGESAETREHVALRLGETRSYLDLRLGETDLRLGETRAYLDLKLGDTRHHMDVLVEGLRDDIRLVAEGYDHLRGDFAQLKAGQARLEAGFERLELRQLALERRAP